MAKRERGEANSKSGLGRKHVVLVPGFVGFDALGQVRYYGGVARAFASWRASLPDARRFVIHYFDNFPTASVAQRAGRLHTYLAEKFSRGELNEGDELALVGHSTGGLDIRALLTLLRERPDEPAPLNDAAALTNRTLRTLIRRVVFLSVPHYGTNLADFATRYETSIQDALIDALHALNINRRIATRVGSAAEVLRRHPADVVAALGDAMVETDGVASARAKNSEVGALLADEREARAELSLWLEHMQSDFAALLDLRTMLDPERDPKSNPENERPVSPAHYRESDRQEELRDYDGALGAPAIATLSFATHAAPFDAPGPLANVVDGFVDALWRTTVSRPFTLFAQLADALVLPRLTLDATFSTVALGALHARPKLLYDLLFRICSHPRGPFTDPSSAAMRRASSPKFRALLSEADIDARSNDGVVNTLSMLWPFDAEAPKARHELVFLRADHADIIGHYRREEPATPLASGRKFVAYDIFPSNSGFTTREHFDGVWQRIFEFAFA